LKIRPAVLAGAEVSRIMSQIFWVHSGLALLDTDEQGSLLVTDEFLRAYLDRQELGLVAESCEGEKALHALLTANPRLNDIEFERGIAAIIDVDVQENFRLFLRLRNRLVAAPNLQAAYVGIFTDAQTLGRIDVPPLFVDQIAQIIIHHLVAQSADGLLLRVAELWFREQRVTFTDGRALLADAERVDIERDKQSSEQSLGSLGRLLAQGNIKTKNIDLDVIDVGNAAQYFGRDEQHDFACEITAGRTASYMLCDLIRRWIGHMLGVAVKVTVLNQIEDERWRWHVGLDQESSKLLDKLYKGEGLDVAENARIALLLRLDFENLSDQKDEVAGKPVYMAIAANDEGLLRMKPQNLLMNLPIKNH
jgi:Family of unknown function (DUF6352)